MSDFLVMRERVVAGISANPVVGAETPEMQERMYDPSQDCTFEELGFDSLARMEFCIFLETEYGIAVTSGELESHPTINAMATWLSGTA